MKENIVKVRGTDRLDRFLVSKFKDWSRTRFQKLIKDKRVLVDGKPSSPNSMVHVGQMVKVSWPEVKKPEIRPFFHQIEVPLIHEDKHLLVIDKPAGLVVHPSLGHYKGDTLVDVMMPRLAEGAWPEELRPGVVHRLDRDTSGVIVMAKTPLVQTKLSHLFSSREVKKTYKALVGGHVKVKEGSLECHLARDPQNRQRYAVSASARGRWALTHFKVKEYVGNKATLVELFPLTGRTHQLRVQLASYGHPVLGDKLYGADTKIFPFIKRHMLHAAILEFTHPLTAKKVRFEAPLPADFQEAVKLIRLNA